MGIKPTLERVKQALSYDSGTGVFTWADCRDAWKNGLPAEYMHVHGYAVIPLDGRQYTASALAWLYETGEWSRGPVKHLNEDKADNRFCNLYVGPKELTPEVLRQIISYEPLSGEISRKNSGSGGGPGIQAGTAHHSGYIQVSVMGKLHLAHRLAVLYMTDHWPEYEVDHINGVRCDNRWSNLREATRGQNRQNLTPVTPGVSGLRGANLHKWSKLWRSRLVVDGVTHSLGYFPTAEDAHKAYLMAKADLHTFQPTPREAACVI
jgi:hypothetical protein